MRKTYATKQLRVDVLNGINITIGRGEIVALTGPSGSGKSTLLNIIGGLDRPSEGDVLINNTNLTQISDRKLAKFRLKNVGFVFQFFYLQPFLTLEQNISVPGIFTGTQMSLLHERSQYLASLVGLDDRLDHVPKELSGGQIQRAAIARALFNNPTVLLADEPTGNLDSKNSEIIIQVFEKIRRELGTTIVVVTHDRAVAARADRNINLLDGVVR